MRDGARKFELSSPLGHPLRRHGSHRHRRRAGSGGPQRRCRRARRPARAPPRLALRLCAQDPGERAAAQDVVQDAFLVALERLDDLRDPAAAAGWLHAIVRNGCRMRLRRSTHELAIEPPEDPRAPNHLEERLDRLAVRDWLWTALERLPPDQRMTIMLRHFGRHASYEAIAATLGVPVGTIRSRLNPGKGQARKRAAADRRGGAARPRKARRATLEAVGRDLARDPHDRQRRALRRRLLARHTRRGPLGRLQRARRGRPAAHRRGKRRHRRSPQADRRRRKQHHHDLGRRLPQSAARSPPLPRDPHRGATPPRRPRHKARALLPARARATNRREDDRLIPAHGRVRIPRARLGLRVASGTLVAGRPASRYGPDAAAMVTCAAQGSF